MRLRPFFPYFGGKYVLARYYPAPAKGSLVIEPFAGSAGYACAYPDRLVTLYDLNPIICSTWDYLINSSTRDILSLPNEIESGEVIADLKISQEAQWLIGWWQTQGGRRPVPHGSKSNWVRDKPGCYWGATVKARIIAQQPFIRHWGVRCQPYEKIKNQNATWFVDPPYLSNAQNYPFKVQDYAHLGEWCKSRKGAVIVCETLGADWMGFNLLCAGDRISISHTRRYAEVVWTKK